jgi:hypothetical protein
MNALVTLLLATSATAADPLPVVQQPVTSPPAYTYAEPTKESRPGLFGRVRGALGLKSSATDQAPSAPTASWPAAWGGPSPSAAMANPSVISGTTVTPPPIRFVPGGSSPEPPLADPVPVTTAAAPAAPAAPPPQVVTPPPSYTYPSPTPAPAPQSNRPRLFGRIRKRLGGPTSQPSEPLPAEYVPAPSPAPRPVPAVVPEPSTPVQQMPSGSPF